MDADYTIDAPQSKLDRSDYMNKVHRRSFVASTQLIIVQKNYPIASEKVFSSDPRFLYSLYVN
jgi:hypothetical protein